MIAFVLRRLAQSVAVMLTVALLAFALFRFVGDPINNMVGQDTSQADRELLRRFYLKHGYIDVRIVSAVGEYVPAQQGFIITFTIEEGDQYRIGSVDVRSKIPALNPHLLEPRLRMSGDKDDKAIKQEVSAIPASLVFRTRDIIRADVPVRRRESARIIRLPGERRRRSAELRRSRQRRLRARYRRPSPGGTRN